MSSELSADGKGVLLNTNAVSPTQERQKARRKAAELALKQPDPHNDLRERLDQLDLNPAKHEPH